jgi:hypothetical protein
MLKCTYFIEIKGAYLHFKVDGLYHFQDFIKFPKIILKHSKATGINRTLFNGSLLKNSDISIIDRFFLGEMIAEVLRNKVKLAIVWPTKDRTKFIEIVTANRAAHIKVAVSAQTALRWLMIDGEAETETALLN